MALMIGPPLGKIGGAEVQTKTMSLDRVRGTPVTLLSAAEVGGGSMVVIKLTEIRNENSTAHPPEVMVDGELVSFLYTDIYQLSATVLEAPRAAGVVAHGEVTIRSSGGSSGASNELDFDLLVSWVTFG